MVLLRGFGDLCAVETVHQQAADTAVVISAGFEFGISDDGLPALLEGRSKVCLHRSAPAPIPSARRRCDELFLTPAFVGSRCAWHLAAP